MSKDVIQLPGWRVGLLHRTARDNQARFVRFTIFLTVGAAAPLQAAGAYAFITACLNIMIDCRVIIVLAAICSCQCSITPDLKTFRPDGAYYIMTDISGFGFADDVEFTRHLIPRGSAVACVPGSSFYSLPERGATAGEILFL